DQQLQILSSGGIEKALVAPQGGALIVHQDKSRVGTDVELDLHGTKGASAHKLTIARPDILTKGVHASRLLLPGSPLFIGYADDLQAGPVSGLKVSELGHGLPARRTPRSPEIEQNQPALVVGLELPD